MNPSYPVYIVSKGRYSGSNQMTYTMFERMRVPYKIIVEKQEYKNYCFVIDKSKILILPDKYKKEYDIFEDIGMKESTGPGAARNYAWDHSISLGAKRHWVLDDNIRGFVRVNNNERNLVTSGTIFKCAEDFVDRYENIAVSGFGYRFFGGGVRALKHPYTLNTRIYSCLLIQNNIPYRWRGRYNEDTDLSLRVLKDGWCTLLFRCFMQNKLRTQTVKGGNTDEFYTKEGTLPKSQILKDMHPDVTRVVYKWGRWHHHVNYKPFKRNKLKRKEGIKTQDGNNNYGMELVDITI